ncbi:MAG: amino acid adenylation domain-containing protein [bacterium]
MIAELLHNNLFASADRLPDNIAFRFADTDVSFAELDRISNQVSRQLAECGTKKGDRVGIFLDRSLESAFAVYGILKAGAVYVPIDPLSPVSRIQNILDSCDIKCLISAPNKAPFISQSMEGLHGLNTILGCATPDTQETTYASHCRFISWSEIHSLADSPFSVVGVRSDDLAYIMFTSGSTGAPKGIMHTHGSGHAYARITVDTYSISPEDRIGNHAPLHFDISTLGYLAAPLAGATTVVIPEPHTRMPASMSKLAEDEKFTIWYSVPFALIQLLTRGVLEQRDLSSLRWVLYGGDPFSPRQIRDLMDHWPGAQFANLYGPAEVNQCTLYLVPGNLKGSEDSIPIGEVWTETEALIVDPDNTMVEIGEIGELLIHTPTMMKGYWNQPDLSARCFFNNPQNNNIYFRTGDLASRNHDNLMYYHGRMDRLIKIRGNRIELDEIEAAILTHPIVEEAAAYVLDSGTEHERLELALLLENESSNGEETFRRYIGERLPKYAVPDRIIFPMQFPRTTSGKIDRRKLTWDRMHSHKTDGDSDDIKNEK